MRRLTFFLVCMVFAGCGYTTRGFVYDTERIYIKPVVNKISITHEGRAYENYTVNPVLLEKKLTNAIINKFNIDGHLSVASHAKGALKLECTINDYRKEALRFTDSDDVTEQRLRLSVRMLLRDEQGSLLKQRKIVGESSFFLSGRLAKSEATAQSDLVDDTARRIVEAVVEDW